MNFDLQGALALVRTLVDMIDAARDNEKDDLIAEGTALLRDFISDVLVAQRIDDNISRRLRAYGERVKAAEDGADSGSFKSAAETVRKAVARWNGDTA